MSTTKQQELEIINLYEIGLSIEKIHIKTGIGEGPIYRIIKNANLMRTRKINENIRKQIFEDFNRGFTTEELHKIYKYNKRTILSILREFGMVLHKKGGKLGNLTEEKVKEIIKRYQNKESQTSIAKTFGVSQTEISKFLIKNGIWGNNLNYPNLKKKIKTGKYLHKASGYIFIKVYPNEPFSDMANITGYVPEHRLIMAKHLGHSLDKKVQIHHINGDRSDNRLENLQQVYGSHGNGICLKCRNCGSNDIQVDEILKT